MLYNMNMSALLLGCLMKNPNLLTQPQYPLDKEDFTPVEFHRVLFVCINNLYANGIGEISEIEIENFVKGHPIQHEVLEDNNYFEFVETVKELANIDNYEYYYQTVRKFSLLRELKANGIDIKEFYDELGDEDKENGKLQKFSIQDILNTIELKGLKLRNRYDVKYVRDEIVVGEDIDNLIDDFKNQPSFGAFLCSPYLTNLIHGFSRGNFILRSAPSGCNKTRVAVADICGLCVDKYWDFEAQDFVDNPNFQGSGFFIHTELDTRTEMQPLFLASVSGVPSNKITMGQCTEEEEKRVKKAAEIIHANNLILTSMPDFTSASLKRKIKECAESYGATFGVFDYMMLNGPLSMEYKQNTGVQAREDMALRGLATDIKSYCEEFNVGILSSTQTNGNEKTMDFPDESCIAGSKAMRNKVDASFIMLPSKERVKEMKIVEPYIKKRSVEKQESNAPNRITYLTKARFGEWSDQRIKVFHRFDPSIMRNTDLFCCDARNRIVNIPVPKYG